MKLDWALFRFPFDDPRWKNKAVIGGALMLAALVGLILIIPFFILLLPMSGYAMRIMRKTAAGEKPFLPEWDHWGDLFKDGLRVVGVGLAYQFPTYVILCCMALVWAAAILGMVGFSDTRGGESASVLMIFGLNALSFVVIGVMTLISLPLTYLQLVALSRMAGKNSFDAAFEFREVMRLARDGFKNYALAFIAYFAAGYLPGLAASLLLYTVILACLYPFVLAVGTVYGVAIMGAAFGQAYYHSSLALKEQPALSETAKASTLAGSTPPPSRTMVATSTPPPATLPPASKAESKTEPIPEKDVKPIEKQVQPASSKPKTDPSRKTESGKKPKPKI